jgi:Ca2+-binding RTX toxin-like protein
MAHSRSRRPAYVVLLSCVALFVLAAPAGAASVTQNGTTLAYAGDATADNLEVRQISATVIEFDASAVALTETGANCVPIGDGGDGGADIECNGPVWTSLAIDLAGGNDTASLDATGMVVSIATTISAGAGNDDVTGGTGPDAIDLGSGNGIAWGIDGADSLSAAPSATDGRPDLHGGDGDDTVNVASAAAGSTLFVTLDAGNDTFVGGPGDTNVQAGAGNDTLTGGAGNETLQGETGQDALAGGDGDDELLPGAVYGPSTGSSDGADSIAGGAGSDTVSYYARSVPVVVDLRTTTGQGEAGENDTIADDVENVTGGSAGDTLIGDDGVNVLRGAAGGDTITGGGGFDQLMGEADADTIDAGADVALDLVNCGATFTATGTPGTDADTANLDYLDIVASGGDCETVNRAAPPSLEPQLGTRGNDVLRGTAAADLIHGLLGNDTISGLAGNDELHGDRGNDRLLGGVGNVELQGGAHRDTLLGGPGADLLVGGTGVDRLDGSAGKDVLIGRDGVAGDVLVCTKVNLASRLQRLQRDIVFADARDVIRNRAWCGRIVVA